MSAFGYAGQKCSAASRLIVVGSIYDQLVDRLVEATRELLVGHPSRPEVQVGPVIDEEAHKRVLRWVEEAPQQGRILGQHDDVPEDGYFVAPTVVEVDDPDAPIAREEIFGPVLTVLRARDLDDAIEIANRSEYALTAGIFSRSPANITRAAAELRVGNVYINRHITGAVVDRQPFGGFGMSGIGSKAGGPDYLHQFLDPRVITENTLRQGFTPETACEGAGHPASCRLWSSLSITRSTRGSTRWCSCSVRAICVVRAARCPAPRGCDRSRAAGGRWCGPRHGNGGHPAR